MAAPVPVVGSPAQYCVPGQPPCAAIVVDVSGGDVSVAYWLATGTAKVKQNCPFLIPGNPKPQGDYAQALPGGPTAVPAGP